MQASVGEVPASRHGDQADGEGREGLEQTCDFDLVEKRRGEKDAGDDVARDAWQAHSLRGPTPERAGGQDDPQDEQRP